METKVSVIIPCFNHAAYLAEAVTSILNQTYSDWECIIINDGSTDNTSEVINILEARDKRIRSVTQVNKGLAAARNAGIALSNSEFFITLDADDYYHPTFIERALAIISDDASIGAVSSYIQHFGVYSAVGKPKGGSLGNFIVSNNAVSAALIRKSIWQEIDGYDERLWGFEDWEFWIALTKQGNQVHIIEEPLFYYRMHSKDSLAIKASKHSAELMKIIIEKHSDIYSQHYVEMIIAQQERLIILSDVIFQKNERIEDLYNSKSYRLGNVLMRLLNRLSKR